MKEIGSTAEVALQTIRRACLGLKISTLYLQNEMFMILRHLIASLEQLTLII